MRVPPLPSAVDVAQKPSPLLSSLVPSFGKLKKVHIIGVGGTLMGSFAAYLSRQGIEVTGSDNPLYPPMSEVLAAADVQVFEGFDPTVWQNAAVKPDWIVIGNVISRQNPEAQAVMVEGGCGVPYSSLPEMMEQFFLPLTRNIVVAGTHGKTTTSSLLAHVLLVAGLRPNYLIGGVAHDLPFSFHIHELAQNHPFVLEGDEYDTAFWDKVPKFNHYLPNDVIVTSLEFDHADIYPDFQAVLQAFVGLGQRIRQGGALIACVSGSRSSGVDTLLTRLGDALPEVLLTYGLEDSGAQFFPKNMTFHPERTTFELWEGERKWGQLELQLPGVHNVLNAVAVWLEARRLGVRLDVLAQALLSFRGVKRRQEVKGEVAGVLMIDDFAHHPTAVRETLKALRARYPARRLVAIFEPRSASSRRKVFQQAFVGALALADLALIAKPYDQSKIPLDQLFSTETLVADLCQKRGAGFAQVLRTSGGGGGGSDDAVIQVAALAQAQDLIVLLSNGHLGGFFEGLQQHLEKIV